jgi:hypothetical protein
MGVSTELTGRPGVIIHGNVVAETRVGLTMSIRGRLVEIPADSLLEMTLAVGEVQLTLARNSQVLMRGSTSDRQGLIESDVFDEFPKTEYEYVSGNCNCNCNCGGGVSNCNCNCNCVCVQSEERVAKGGTFRRLVLGTNVCRAEAFSSCETE